MMYLQFFQDTVERNPIAIEKNMHALFTVRLSFNEVLSLRDF